MSGIRVPEWRDVSALRAELERSPALVDYHGGEILDWLDEAPIMSVPTSATDGQRPPSES